MRPVEKLSVQCGFVDLAWQVFRQMRAEYFRLSEKGLLDADVLDKLRDSYQTMVNRTDPLQKYRGDKVPEKWTCPKVSSRPASSFSRQEGHDHDVSLNSFVVCWPLSRCTLVVAEGLRSAVVLVVAPPGEVRENRTHDANHHLRRHAAAVHVDATSHD